LSLQKAGDGFEIDDYFAQVLGSSVKELKKVAKQMDAKGGEDKYVILSTSIMLAILDRDFPGQKGYCEHMIEKSRRWALRSSASIINGITLSEWTATFLKGVMKIQAA
jgi:hypothetical protein